MLFNSYEFLFLFFPITVALFFLSLRIGGRSHLFVLFGASLVFYGSWDIRFLFLLVSSFTLNYVAGCYIFKSLYGERHRSATWAAAVAIALNLGALATFKYANFVTSNVDSTFGTSFGVYNLILPLGISFFTFEQISFLVDVRRGQARPSLFLHYALFVSFFPRLVAGPILRYNEIAPQFAHSHIVRADDIAVGLTIFFIGLVKKAVLADGIAPYVAPVFAMADRGEQIDLLLAWGGALAYTCQLYFDFSGYSDMAIGAARCFGIRFPINFNSPYKAGNIIEFWRRWHMTLSRFLRDYLYFALGGNRRGWVRRYSNLFITMVLGGLWHGANWTFIAWGGLHGIFLILNHGWLTLSERSPVLMTFRNSRVWAGVSWAITFVAVIIGWVFFRSPNFYAAFNMLTAMAGFHGVVIPSGLEFALEPVRGALLVLGVTFADGSGTALVLTYLWVIGLLGIALLLPNTQEILGGYPGVAAPDDAQGRITSQRVWWEWQLSPQWAIVIGLAAFLGVISITRVSEFLYWQF